MKKTGVMFRTKNNQGEIDVKGLRLRENWQDLVYDFEGKFAL
jgi:hypothetical protein